MYFSEYQGEVDTSQKKLERATEIIGGLGGEGERWLKEANDLGDVYKTITGKHN